MAFTVRDLEPDDAQAFQAIRLQALREHPEAFASSYESEARRSLDDVRTRLSPSAEGYTLGAFSDGRLVGMLHFARRVGEKLRHRAVVGAMFVLPEARNRGVGKGLLETCVKRSRRLEGLETLVLAVSVGNEAARKLYLSAGFRPYCLEPDFIKLGERYVSIEWLALELGG